MVKHQCTAFCLPPAHAYLYYEPKGTTRTPEEIVACATERGLLAGVQAREACKDAKHDLYNGEGLKMLTWEAWVVSGELLKDWTVSQSVTEEKR